MRLQIVGGRHQRANPEPASHYLTKLLRTGFDVGFMISVSFTNHDHGVGSPHVIQAGQFDLLNVRTQLLEHGHRPLHRGDNLGVDAGVRIEEVVSGQSDPHSANIFLKRQRVVGHRRAARRRVFGIVARDCLQHVGGVFHRPGHRASVVLGPAQSHHTVPADPAVGGLQAHDAAQGGWPTNRSARAGSQCAQALTRGHRRTRPTARAPRDVIQIPRVSGRFKRRRPVRAAQRKLVHRQLTQQDASGSFETCGGRGVLGRYTINIHVRPRSGPDACGVIQVLQSKRDSVHCPFVVAAQNLCFGDASLLQCFISQQQNERMQLSIRILNTVQASPGQFNRREFSFPHQLAGLVNGQKM